MSDIDIYTSIIANVGFPIAIAGYLLMRFEGILSKNTEALQALIVALKCQSDEVKK